MSKQWTTEAMQQRLVRYTELRPCTNAFVDTYTPGSDKKENFTVIGPGVAEHPDQYVHITEPHGFNIGGARQPPGCTNSQHSHETEEVFIVHSGRWAFRWGDQCQDGEAVLGPGDCISIPVNVFRGFENVGDDVGYLFAVLGGDDPGNVLWAPDVFDKACEYGLVLLENGRLVDTTRGEQVPAGVNPKPKTTEQQVKAHRVMSVEEMLECVYREEEQCSRAGSALTDSVPGVAEYALIGPASQAEGVPAGKMAWPHGFQVRRMDFEPAARLPFHARHEEEVVYLHSGELLFSWDGGELTLQQGDVLTVPRELMHGFSNPGASNTVAYVVRGGDAPAAAVWMEAPTRSAAAN
ncbi:cupin domain-containing protein [Pseudohalioglobus sediminis]|uniref:Cupin domain-containing protein n=1 Tax=Pseudohalioglobus sediminis TaxID=2606449 RepID=A0A5B0WRQ4_9GAMM|nr:cupin domain-containing protein [Pseudohalioglobus sediminis]KAA1189127.1 cupin domain-containing protein [Pseudohalioglobus sediminis]